MYHNATIKYKYKSKESNNRQWATDYILLYIDN